MVPDRVTLASYALCVAAVGAGTPLALQALEPAGSDLGSAEKRIETPGPRAGKVQDLPFAGPAPARSGRRRGEEWSPAFRAQASVATVVLVAARGDCWAVVRSGTASGKVLYEGLLAQGSSRRFSATRVWLSLGAAQNVNVTLDGEPVPIPQGTTNILVPSRV